MTSIVWWFYISKTWYALFNTRALCFCQIFMLQQLTKRTRRNNERNHFKYYCILRSSIEKRENRGLGKGCLKRKLCSLCVSQNRDYLVVVNKFNTEIDFLSTTTKLKSLVKYFLRPSNPKIRETSMLSCYLLLVK